MPGVGLIATFINNVIDNNFIYKANVQTNFIIAIILSVVIALGLLFINSTVLSVAFAISLAIVYVIVATVLMHYFNLWVGVILPILMMATTFIVMYIYKYLLKAKDLEYTYKLATTDAMTGLYNHRYFQEQMFLSVETAKRYEGVTSLILIDIDFFKKFNDTYGHQAGDAVLKQVAQVIKQNIRTTDIPCRYGGEEMSVILSNTNYEKALLTAQKICDAVSSRQFKLNNVVTVNVTISLGVAAFPKDAKSVEDMIEAADKNLYLAKENGRNQVGNFVKQNSENENIDNN
ncbi:MAG: GGDEF domain-containing protein [Candidatus Melainabacteria bacterium]|nr:MAG: GGDEF domain-containing protein [Candidatus Melainabacteria bacterium]